MAFTTTTQPTELGTGIERGHNITTSYSKFITGLKIGLFARLSAGSILNLDGTATPNIVGVVRRSISNAVESESNYVTGVVNIVDVVESGLVTVKVATGVNPVKNEKVYAINTVGVEIGKATNVVGTNIPVDGVFYEKVSATVWTIKLK